MRRVFAFYIFGALILLGACFSDPRKEVPLLIEKLSAKDSSARNQACLRLGSFGSQADLAVPKLIQLLHDPNNGVRTSAAFALRSIGGEKAERALLTYKKYQ